MSLINVSTFVQLKVPVSVASFHFEQGWILTSNNRAMLKFAAMLNCLRVELEVNDCVSQSSMYPRESLFVLKIVPVFTVTSTDVALQAGLTRIKELANATNSSDETQILRAHF